MKASCSASESKNDGSVPKSETDTNRFRSQAFHIKCPSGAKYGVDSNDKERLLSESTNINVRTRGDKQQEAGKQDEVSSVTLKLPEGQSEEDVEPDDIHNTIMVFSRRRSDTNVKNDLGEGGSWREELLPISHHFLSIGTADWPPTNGNEANSCELCE